MITNIGTLLERYSSALVIHLRDLCQIRNFLHNCEEFFKNYIMVSYNGVLRYLQVLTFSSARTHADTRRCNTRL